MTDFDPTSAFDRLTAFAGIHESHADAFGTTARASEAARKAILRDFGLGCDTAEEAMASMAKAVAIGSRPAPEFAVITAGAGAQLNILHGGFGFTAELSLEDGTTLALSNPQDLPSLPAGYHILRLMGSAGTFETLILAAPPRCYEPPELAAGKRLWGIAAQTYGLHSCGSIGMGDFGDVQRLTKGAASLGASFVGLSPSHCLFPANRGMISPYSPSTRLYLDPIYLDLSALPGFVGSSAATLLAEMGGEIASARQSTLVDYAAVWAIKQPVLARWSREMLGKDNLKFSAFKVREGHNLVRFALFETLSEYFVARGLAWSGHWPDEFISPDTAAVAAFGAAHMAATEHHMLLQWACDRQLAAVAQTAAESGMAVGLYRDLAVGSDRGGCENWAAPGAYAASLSIGAPPDPLAPQGQNWGLPPLDPLHLKRDHFRAFRAPIAANMRHAGALRIDHAFQLARLFLVPPGVAPGDGAYVDYPLQAMLAVLRIESHRARCVVIAEDLGTAPPGFSERIMESGLFSCKVVPFERSSGGGFSAPATYPRQAMAMAGTHDLPTFVGWWHGADIALREKLGIFDFVTSLGLQAARRREIGQFCEALASEGLLPSPAIPAEPPLVEATGFLARTPSAIAAVQLEDALSQAEQANLPGTTEGHPNWRRKLSVNVETICAKGSELARLAEVMQREGR